MPALDDVLEDGRWEGGTDRCLVSISGWSGGETQWGRKRWQDVRKGEAGAGRGCCGGLITDHGRGG